MSENAIRGLLMHLLGIPKVINTTTIDQAQEHAPIAFFDARQRRLN